MAVAQDDRGFDREVKTPNAEQLLGLPNTKVGKLSQQHSSCPPLIGRDEQIVGRKRRLPPYLPGLSVRLFYLYIMLPLALVLLEAM